MNERTEPFYAALVKLVDSWAHALDQLDYYLAVGETSTCKQQVSAAYQEAAVWQGTAAGLQTAQVWAVDAFIQAGLYGDAEFAAIDAHITDLHEKAAAYLTRTNALFAKETRLAEAQ